MLTNKQANAVKSTVSVYMVVQVNLIWTTTDEDISDTLTLQGDTLTAGIFSNICNDIEGTVILLQSIAIAIICDLRRLDVPHSSTLFAVCLFRGMFWGRKNMLIRNP